MVAHARASHCGLVVTPLACLDRPVVLESERLHATWVGIHTVISHLGIMAGLLQARLFQALQMHFPTCEVLPLTRPSSKILSPPRCGRTV